MIHDTSGSVPFMTSSRRLCRKPPSGMVLPKPLASGLYRSSMAGLYAGPPWLVTWRSAGIFSISARQCRKLIISLQPKLSGMFW
ncbi:hypothetical protein D3C87_1693230 [compost metagenome]